MSLVMAFYNPDPLMDQTLADVVGELQRQRGRPDLGRQLSMTWLLYEQSPRDRAADLERAEIWRLPVRGGHWEGSRPRYPASVVKLVYLIAAQEWLREQWLEESDELGRALADMIRDSSNDATGLVVDLLTGTTSGPSLPSDRFIPWVRQRQLVNQWLERLDWPEWHGCNVCQKTWSDGPYGRERDFYGDRMENRNRLTTDVVARLLHGVMAGALVSPPACRRMQGLLARSLDPMERKADPENQVDGFLGEALPTSARLWSKAGWMSQARHDAAYVEVEGCRPFLLVVFSEGESCARDEKLLPAIARSLLQASRP